MNALLNACRIIYLFILSFTVIVMGKTVDNVSDDCVSVQCF